MSVFAEPIERSPTLIMFSARMHHRAEDHQENAAAKEADKQTAETARERTGDDISLRYEITDAGTEQQADKDRGRLEEIVLPANVHADGRPYR
jgi:hypothetical protein